MKVWDVLIIVGVIVGIIGCFLPWGRNYPTMQHPEHYAMTGTSSDSGISTLMGLILAAMFQLVFIFKRKVYMIFAVLISGLATLFVSGNWIRYPSYIHIPEFWPVPITPPGGILPPTALYGAYVTLLGALIVSAMAFLYIAATAKQQLSLRKLNQRT